MCHGVMYQQLSAWLLHGMLIDNHREFFICDVSDEDVGTDTTASDKMDSGNDLGIPGITGKQLAEIMVGHFVGLRLILFNESKFFICIYPVQGTVLYQS